MPPRVLPADVEVVASPGGLPTDPDELMTVDQLKLWNAIAPDADARWEYPAPHEASSALWLRARGVRVRSVREFKKRRPPDAVVVAADRLISVEFKTLQPSNGQFDYLTCLDNVEGLP